MCTAEYVQGAIDALMDEPLFTTILTPDLGEVGLPPKRRKTRSMGPAKPQTAEEFALAEQRRASVLGKPPPQLPRAYSKLEGTGAEELGFVDPAVYIRLQMFLQENGGYTVGPSRADGSCMFTSVLHLLDSCQEYTQVHFRRDLVLLAAEYPEYVFQDVKEHIRFQYNPVRLSKEEYEAKKAAKELTDEEEYNYTMPGPFSFVGWLRHQLGSNSWGDGATLILMSLKLQVAMATVDADSLLVTRYRQEWGLELQEIVLVFQNKNHYLPCGE